MALYKVNKPRNPQANFHVKKNDEVVVLTGTQQGKRGKVLEVLRDRSRVIVEGVNFIKKASRKSQEQPQGGIIERDRMSNLLRRMNTQTFVLNTRGALQSAPPVVGFGIRLVDEHTLEADIAKEQDLNGLFVELSRLGVEVLSMRNKINRLEEIFMHLVETSGHAAAGTAGTAAKAAAPATRAFHG